MVLPAAVVGLLAGAVPAVSAPSAPTEPRAAYTQQRIDWGPCEGLPESAPAVAKKLRCGEFSAPMDWDDPADGDDVTIAVSKLPATGTARGAILTNPGGPGGPGRLFPVRFREQQRMRANYDIIGFDPRGTGESSNITCGGATSNVDPLDPRDRSQENLDLILDTTEAAADACQRKSGELGRFINTYQTVRDIDLLRTLLDRKKISWIGYSAGTWLGAQYATAFPGRVEKMVFDSNIDFTANWQKAFDWQPLGFERRWRADFLPWLARHHDIYGYGRTAQAARVRYEKVRNALEADPVKLDGKTIGPNEFDIQISGAMYNKLAFPGLGEYLRAVRDLAMDRAHGQRRVAALDTLRRLRLRDDNGGPLPLAVGIDGSTGAPRAQVSGFGGESANPPGGEYDDAFDASFWTIPCNETEWRGDRRSVVAQSDYLGKRYPLLGWGWLVQPCVFWDNDPIDLPTPTGEGVPPVLMVQSTHDPATPLEGARRAHANFAGSRMITVTNEGDHGIYAGGNGCVDNLVNAYLVDNQVPPDTLCPGTPLPEPETTPARQPERGVSFR
ncbi:alpha/beta hydrolase [Haloechinothrix salitolerans]